MSEKIVKGITSPDGFEIFNARVYDLYESMMAAGYSFEKDEVKKYDEDISMRFVNEDKKIQFYTSGIIDGDKREIAKRNYKTLQLLGSSEVGSGEDSFLKGIRVSFDVKYSTFWTPQAQRYTFLDFVSSTSAMHCITKFELDKFFTNSTSKISIDLMKKIVDIYNKLENDEKFILVEYKITLPHGIVIYNVEKTTNGLVNLDNYKKMDLSFQMETIKTIDTKRDLYEYIISTCPQGLMKTVRISTNYLQLKTIYFQRKNHKLRYHWGTMCEWIETLPFFKELVLNK